MRQAPYEVPAARRIRVIIDTDCACEADDQFAVVHQLMTPKLEVVGITAAQFGTHFGAASAAESVRRSYDEICRLLELTGLTGAVPVLQGCAHPLPDEQTPGRLRGQPVPRRAGDAGGRAAPLCGGAGGADQPRLRLSALPRDRRPG